MSAINVDNIAAKGFSFYTPAQLPAAGTAIVPQPNGREIPLLFKPLKIRGVEFQNRIFVSLWLITVTIKFFKLFRAAVSFVSILRR